MKYMKVHRIGKKIMRVRTLWDCRHAVVIMACFKRGDRIGCRKGHRFGTHDGTVPLLRAERGDPLIEAVCQECEDYESMGRMLAREERGWK